VSDWHASLRTVDGGPVLRFYEKAKVLASDPSPEIRGEFGWILGVSADEATIYGYSVHFDDRREGYFVAPKDLAGTGEIASRERFYSGESIRVAVDKHGRGRIAD